MHISAYVVHSDLALWSPDRTSKTQIMDPVRLICGPNAHTSQQSRVWPGMTDLQQKLHAEVGHTEYLFGGHVLCRPRNRKTSQADVGDDITRACHAIPMAGQAGGTALDLELQA